MLVIITEDSKSGKQFWDITKRIVLQNTSNCEVVIAGTLGRSYAATDVGGISKVKHELDYQVMRLCSLQGRHLILLAVDNVMSYAGANGSTVMHVQRLANHVRLKYASNAQYNRIKIVFTGYCCIEEVFLSFKYLTEYCCVKAAPANARDKAKQIYKEIHTGIVTAITVYGNYLENLNFGRPLTAIDPSSDLYFLYSKYKYKRNLKVRDMENREVMASLALEYISSVTNGIGFKIGKSTISSCWHTTCTTPCMAYTTATNCSKCELYMNRIFTDRLKWGKFLSDSLLLHTGNVSLDSLKQYV